MDESDLLDAMRIGMDEVDDLSGQWFTISGQKVKCNFSSGDETLELTTIGGQRERLKGTMILSRSRLKEKPKLLSIITDDRGVRYRIADIAPDAAAWLLTLTAPNGNSPK